MLLLFFSYVLTLIYCFFLPRYNGSDAIVECLPGYRIDDLSETMPLVCKDGKWFVSSDSHIKHNNLDLQLQNEIDSIYSKSLSQNHGYLADSKYSDENFDLIGEIQCKPVCKQSCQNEGTCITPDKCLCKEAFTGHLCQHEKCQGSPKKLPNSIVSFK